MTGRMVGGGNGFAFRLGSFDPGGLSLKDFRQSLLRRFAESGAVGKIGDVGDVAVILFAEKTFM
jgi:hypothetical protein